jgi:hypothetical protein
LLISRSISSLVVIQCIFELVYISQISNTAKLLKAFETRLSRIGGTESVNVVHHHHLALQPFVGSEVFEV